MWRVAAYVACFNSCGVLQHIWRVATHVVCCNTCSVLQHKWRVTAHVACCNTCGVLQHMCVVLQHMWRSVAAHVALWYNTIIIHVVWCSIEISQCHFYLYQSIVFNNWKYFRYSLERYNLHHIPCAFHEGINGSNYCLLFKNCMHPVFPIRKHFRFKNKKLTLENIRRWIEKDIINFINRKQIIAIYTYCTL